MLHKCSSVTHVLWHTLPRLLPFLSRFITPGLETAFCLVCRWLSVLAFPLLDAPRTPTTTKDMLLSRCPRATATCDCHDVWCRPLPPYNRHMWLPRRLVSPILLPATRRSTNNDHRAQTNHRHLNMGNVVPYASKFREKRCWCNLLRCSRCIPRIVLVPMPRMQGQRIADLGGVTVAPRIGSFHFGFHYAIYFSVSGILLAYELLMLDSFNYGPWTNLKFNYCKFQLRQR